MTARNPTVFAIRTIDRLEGQPAFAAAPLLWPSITTAIAVACAKTGNLGALIDEVRHQCSLLSADYTISRGQGLTNGGFWRELEAAMRAEFANPSTDRTVTIDLAALAPAGSA
jgi:hypothetical protein